MNTQPVQQPKHSLAELQAMPDGELNALAATGVMGWHWNEDVGAPVGWLGADNQVKVDWLSKWSPVNDRNQSGQLLEAMAARGAGFNVLISADPEDEPSAMWGTGRDLGVVPGNSARSETIAAILAHEALGGK